MKRYLPWIAVVMLTACGGGEPSFQLGTQSWNDVHLTIEARQSPADPAIFEFLMVGSNAQQRPANNLTVSIRIREQDRWKQAIQDGLVGVYRRAYKVNDPRVDALQVQIRRGDEEGVLQFALAPLAGPPASR